MLLMFTTLPKAAKKTEAHDILLLGIPTRYYGEAQCDWDDFFPTLEEIDFNGKLVALFGCGDQKITQNTSATRWAPSATSLSRAADHRRSLANGGVSFEASKAADDDHFVGLAIDEDRQPELTNERVEKWVKQVAEELHLEEIKNA